MKMDTIVDEIRKMHPKADASAWAYVKLFEKSKTEYVCPDTWDDAWAALEEEVRSELISRCPMPGSSMSPRRAPCAATMWAREWRVHHIKQYYKQPFVPDLLTDFID